jgi:hypothetical protein
MSQPPTGLQDWIYSLETGKAQQWMHRVLMFIIGSVIFGLYLFTEARNFSNPEAMDKAQLARNIATGKGYTTQVIRPLTLQLLRERSIALGQPNANPLSRPVPDIQNAPVYPLMLAGLFKVLPGSWLNSLPDEPSMRRPMVEHVVTVFNLLWLALAAFLTYRIGRHWFDHGTGMFAAFALGGTELFWRMSSNGLDTTFLIVIVLLVAALIHHLGDLADLNPAEPPPVRSVLLPAAALGLLIAIGCLSRYAFGWLLLPAIGCILWFSPRRAITVAVTTLVFAMIVGPWIARNYHLSGHAFGTASFAIDGLTMTYPGDLVERYLDAPTSKPDITDYRVKLSEQAGVILRDRAASPFNNWLWFFFLAGLVLPFQRPLLNRLRWFTVASLFTFALMESMGATYLSSRSDAFHSENLMCLVAPLCILFGTAFFYTLLESTHFGHPILRSTCVTGIWTIISLPLLTSVLPPRSYPMVQPVYRPDIIQALASYMEPDDLMMSDIPWAVAWYGNRDCISLTLNVENQTKEDFYAVHDFLRPIKSLYLSPNTTEVSVRLMVIDIENQRWAWTYLDALVRRNLPRGFPLKVSYQGSARAGHLFLADRQRW